jgi:hypothetical protein
MSGKIREIRDQKSMPVKTCTFSLIDLNSVSAMKLAANGANEIPSSLKKIDDIKCAVMIINPYVVNFAAVFRNPSARISLFCFFAARTPSTKSIDTSISVPIKIAQSGAMNADAVAAM